MLSARSRLMFLARLILKLLEGGIVKLHRQAESAVCICKTRPVAYYFTHEHGIALHYVCFYRTLLLLVLILSIVLIN